MREERKERGEEGRGEGRKEGERREKVKVEREGRRERNKGEHHIAMLQEQSDDVPYLQLDSLAL